MIHHAPKLSFSKSPHSPLFLFQQGSVMEGSADTLSECDIAVMYRIVCDEVHLLHIRLTIFRKIFLITNDVDYLRDDIESTLRLI